MHSHIGANPSLPSSPQQRRIALQSVGTRTLQEATLAARRKASELERQKACRRENKLQLVVDTDSDPAANRAIEHRPTHVSPAAAAAARRMQVALKGALPEGAGANSFRTRMELAQAAAGAPKGMLANPRDSLMVRAKTMAPGSAEAAMAEAASRAKRRAAAKQWEKEVVRREQQRENLRVQARELAKRQAQAVLDGHTRSQNKGTRRVELRVELDAAYDDRNILKREHMRHHPRVLKRLNQWWRTFGEHLNGSKKPNGIPRAAYFAMQHNIARVLLPYERKQNIETLLRDEWSKKPKANAEHLTESEYYDDIFDLVDLWTKTVELDEYVELLDTLLPFAAGQALEGEEGGAGAEGGRWAKSGGGRWRKLRIAAKLQTPRSLKRWANVVAADGGSSSDEGGCAEEVGGGRHHTRKASVEEEGPQPDWTVSKLAHWLRSHGLGSLVPAFRKKGIDGAAIRTMSEEDAHTFRMSCTRKQWMRLQQLVHGQEEMLRRAEASVKSVQMSRYNVAAEAKAAREQEAREVQEELRARVHRSNERKRLEAEKQAIEPERKRRAALLAYQAECVAQEMEARRKRNIARANAAAQREAEAARHREMEEGWRGIGNPRDNDSAGGAAAAGLKALSSPWYQRVTERASGPAPTEAELVALYTRLASEGATVPTNQVDYRSRVPYDPDGLAMLVTRPKSAPTARYKCVSAVSAADAAVATAAGGAARATGTQWQDAHGVINRKLQLDAWRAQWQVSSRPSSGSRTALQSEVNTEQRSEAVPSGSLIIAQYQRDISPTQELTVDQRTRRPSQAEPSGIGTGADEDTRGQNSPQTEAGLQGCVKLAVDSIVVADAPGNVSEDDDSTEILSEDASPECNTQRRQQLLQRLGHEDRRFCARIDYAKAVELIGEAETGNDAGNIIRAVTRRCAALDRRKQRRAERKQKKSRQKKANEIAEANARAAGSRQAAVAAFRAERAVDLDAARSRLRDRARASRARRAARLNTFAQLRRHRGGAFEGLEEELRQLNERIVLLEYFTTKIGCGKAMSAAPPAAPASTAPAVTVAAAAPPQKVSQADFMFGAELGRGAYASVMHAQLKASGDGYAVKIMEKAFIKKENKLKFVLNEKNVLARLSHPRIIKLHFAFQDKTHLFMVMQLCPGGELLDVITQHRKQQQVAGNRDVCMNVELARFYVCEIVDALEYLHTNGVVHRDIKPENVVIDADGHIKLVDFGTAKDATTPNATEKKDEFGGTALYVSPEVLDDREASPGSDLWALGVVLFFMLVGRPRFGADSEFLTFQQIIEYTSSVDEAEGFGEEDGGGAGAGEGEGEGEGVGARQSWADSLTDSQGLMAPMPEPFPESFPSAAKDLVERLLRKRPSSRLGAGADGSDGAGSARGNGYAALRAHPFFDGVDFGAVRREVPPYVPPVRQLPPATDDGADEGWMFAGLNEEMQAAGSMPFSVAADEANAAAAVAGGGARDIRDDGAVATSAAELAQPAPVGTSSQGAPSQALQHHDQNLAFANSDHSPWKGLLLQGETIVRCGLVKKQANNPFWFAKNRQLILTDRPRLIYASVSSGTLGELRGEVTWTPHLRVTSKSKAAFEVTVPKPNARTYHFTDLEKPPTSAGWVAAISALLH
eukprot:g1052.t1